MFRPLRQLRRALPCALLFALAAAPGSALAAPPPTAVVTMGDSYISGEAGRWLGNSANIAGSTRRDRPGVRVHARAVHVLRREPRLPRRQAASGCHRSDVAEVRSARLPVGRAVNVACSGAVTTNLLRSSSGGTTAHGEAPQADQLLPIARSTRIRMIVVSVGGNDLGFASIVTACFQAYLTQGAPCSQTQAAALSDAKLAEATAKIEHAIDEIRAVMREAGSADSDYRLVLQTYPVVIPHARDARYVEADPRRSVEGCPFYDADMDWAQDVAAPRIGNAVKVAASSRGAEVLELLRAFAGHEVCAKSTSAVSLLAPPSPVSSEWGRAVSASTIAQGQIQELFHPNAYGQMALGSCVRALYAARRGSYACANVAPRGPGDMVLTALP